MHAALQYHLPYYCRIQWYYILILPDSKTCVLQACFQYSSCPWWNPLTFQAVSAAMTLWPAAWEAWQWLAPEPPLVAAFRLTASSTVTATTWQLIWTWTWLKTSLTGLWIWVSAEALAVWLPLWPFQTTSEKVQSFVNQVYTRVYTACLLGPGQSCLGNPSFALASSRI